MMFQFILFFILAFILLIEIFVIFSIFYQDTSFNFAGWIHICKRDKERLLPAELFYVVAHENAHNLQHPLRDTMMCGRLGIRYQEAFAEAYSIRVMLAEGYTVEEVRIMSHDYFCLKKYGMRWKDLVTIAKKNSVEHGDG